MTKPWTEGDLSSLLDGNLTFRLRELSDLKRAIKDATPLSRVVLLKAVIALSYAHWEGFVKFSADKYFEFIAIRKYKFVDLKPSFYANSFLVRLGTYVHNKPSIKERLDFISRIANSGNDRFAYLNPDLINTGSNLNFEVLKNICLVCEIDTKPFEAEESFIDKILLKRRNAIAHGEEAIVNEDEIDGLINGTIGLMRSFKNELENKVYTKDYLNR